MKRILFGLLILFVITGCPNEVKIKNIPSVSDYNIDGLGQYIYDGTIKEVTITPKAGKSRGAITIYYKGSKNAPSDISAYPVTFDIAAIGEWEAVYGLYAGTMSINTPVIPANVTTLTADKWADGNIDSPSGEQWFKFTATADTQYIHFEPGTLSDVYIQVYDNTGATVEGQTIRLGNGFNNYRNVTNGNDYYIRVMPSSGSGTYRVTFNTFPISPNRIVTLTTDTWADGNIDFSQGEQWFKFSATADTKYIFFETGTINYISIEVYDYIGTEVMEKYFYNTNVHTYNTSITHSGNEYYIRVRPYYSGGGTYRIAFNSLPIPPNSIVNELIADTWTYGNITVYRAGQWFKFTATANHQYIHFKSDSISNIDIQVYDNTGTSIGDQANLYISDSFIFNKLYTSLNVISGNEYYIGVDNNYSIGTYWIGFNSSTTQPSIFEHPASTVNILAADTWAEGYNAGAGGERWFKFTAMADTQYIHFKPGTLSNVYIQLYDNTVAEVVSRTNLYSGNLSTSLSVTIGNEYYIRVTPYMPSDSGAYRIAFNIWPLPPNTNITTLTPDTWAEGNITTSGNRQEGFKFIATAANQYIHFEPGTLSDVYIQVYYNTGTAVGNQTHLYSSTLYTSQTLTIGNEYYIIVKPYSSSSSGAYRIAFNICPLPPDTNVTTLSSGTWANGGIAVSDGVQWFKFNATAATQYIHFEPGLLSNIYIQLYDNTGTTVGSLTNMSSSTLYTSQTVINSKEYYIRVTPYGSGYSGAYKIAFSTATAKP